MGKVVIKLSEMVSVNPDKEFSMLLKNTEKYRNTMPGSIHVCVPRRQEHARSNLVAAAGTVDVQAHTQEHRWAFCCRTCKVWIIRQFGSVEVNI